MNLIGRKILIRILLEYEKKIRVVILRNNWDGFSIEMPRLVPISQASKPRRWLLGACVRIGSVLLVVLTAIALIRLGPGSENDERDLDPALSQDTRAALHAEKRAAVQHF